MHVVKKQGRDISKSEAVENVAGQNSEKRNNKFDQTGELDVDGLYFLGLPGRKTTQFIHRGQGGSGYQVQNGIGANILILDSKDEQHTKFFEDRKNNQYKDFIKLPVKNYLDKQIEKSK